MPGTIPGGVYWQAWTGAHGFTAAGFAQHLDRIAQLNAAAGSGRRPPVSGVLIHAGPRWMQHIWPKLQSLCTAHGLAALAAYGLDGHDDVDGTILTAAEKGSLMADIALDSVHRPLGTVFDCEAYSKSAPSQWDDAQTLGTTFRDRAKLVYVTHQPWFDPDEHWNYPYEALAVAADEVAPQVYCNEGSFIHQWGKLRRQKVWDWYERSWAKLEQLRLSKIGQVDPRFETVQSAGWDDIPWEFARQLLGRPRTFCWSEWAPSDLWYAILEAGQALINRGFWDGTAAGFTGAVARFQTDYNSTANEAGKILVDDKMGRQVLDALGVVI